MRKKKILFISSLSSVFHFPLWEVFEYFGFEIDFIDYRGSAIFDAKNPIQRAIHIMPSSIKNYLYNKANAEIDKNILRKAYKFKPDYIFANKAKYIAIPILEEMKTIAPTINWYSDMMSNWTTIQKIINHYDYFFNYDRYVIDLLQKQGHTNSYHLPWAGHLKKDAKWLDKKDYKHDIVFIGSYDPKLFPRESSFEGLRELGLKIWGNKNWLKTSFRDCYRGLITPNQNEVQKVYSNSKIGIYLDSLYNVPGTGITLRPFEITAAGTMMIGQVYRKELSELFEADKEFVPFKNTNELKSKARYWLDHENERELIAKSGFERTLRDHTYIDRIKKVFEIVEKNPPKRFIS